MKKIAKMNKTMTIETHETGNDDLNRGSAVTARKQKGKKKPKKLVSN